jgi:hypothetical protein
MDGGGVDAGEEVGGVLVVASGDGPELLELAEEVLDQMTCGVEVAVEGLRLSAMALGWDGRGLASLAQTVERALIGVISTVGEQRRRHEPGQQHVAAAKVMRLAWRQVKADRIAQRVNQGVELGTQPASGRAYGLVGTVFLAAPALC